MRDLFLLFEVCCLMVLLNWLDVGTISRIPSSINSFRSQRVVTASNEPFSISGYRS